MHKSINDRTSIHQNSTVKLLIQRSLEVLYCVKKVTNKEGKILRSSSPFFLIPVNPVSLGQRLDSAPEL